MSKSNTWESDLLNLVFNNTTASGIGDTTGLVGSTSAGVLYVSLHTADPGEAGNQTTNEATYTGYTRVSVARTSAGWTVSGSAPTQAANFAQVTFPQAAVGTPTNVLTHVGVGTSTSTTIAVGSNGQSLPQATINVASTTGFPSSGTILVFTSGGYQTVTYAGTSGGTQFTGCSGGTGTMTTGGPVTQAGKLLYSGALQSTLTVNQNITPSYAAGALVITED